MTRGGVQVVGLLLAGLVGHALADESILLSRPSGAFLVVDGPLRITGTTPLDIAELPPGEYRLTVDTPGLPHTQGRFWRTQTGLHPLPQARMRSLLIPPGLSHLPHERMRGFLFLSSGVASTWMLLDALAEVDDHDDELGRAQAAYDAATTEAELWRARDQLTGAALARDDGEEIATLWSVYLGASWLGAALENLVLTSRVEPRDIGEGGFLLDLPRTSPWKLAVLSALVPGSGQRHQGRSFAANVFAGSVALASAGAILAQDSFLEARRDQTLAQERLDRATTDAEITSARNALDAAADEAQERSNARWVLVGLAAALHGWNVLDAFRLGEDESRVAPTVAVVGTGDGLRAQATWSLP